MELEIRRVKSFEKKWFIRIMAIAIYILCSISLSDVGEPRSFDFNIISGLGNSLFLNLILLLCAIKMPKGKIKNVMALLLLASGLGVFIIIPYGWTVESLAFLFHLWLTYELVSSRGLK